MRLDALEPHFRGQSRFRIRALQRRLALISTRAGPRPGGIETTVRNLEDVAPTMFLNVPKGFEWLLPFLRDRREFRERFFSRLKLMYYAGAGLSQPVWDELQQQAVERAAKRS